MELCQPAVPLGLVGGHPLTAVGQRPLPARSPTATAATAAASTDGSATSDGTTTDRRGHNLNIVRDDTAHRRGSQARTTTWLCFFLSCKDEALAKP